jgi:D-alanine-D-alanine ligase
MSLTSSPPVAILYQAISPPAIDGAVKPLKSGGYSDSGADIAFALRSAGISVVTPVSNPDPACDLDWVFPDDQSGIQMALRNGAQVLWANTVLFSGHPLTKALPYVKIVGQNPEKVEQFDDKWMTNGLLREAGLPVVSGCKISSDVRPDSYCPEELTERFLTERGLHFPMVLKPVRGRGSQGVLRIPSLDVLRQAVNALMSATYSDGRGSHSLYGTSLILEEYLPGEEISITVMPPGTYEVEARVVVFAEHWSLPPVARLSHQNGIAPYSSTLAVRHNSVVLTPEEIADLKIKAVLDACTHAAQIVGAAAPIRIDCRQDDQGVFSLFDLNMKPNMTGPGRPGRDTEDSLTAMAAQAIGWSFPDLVKNILAQSWSVPGPRLV